jgi:hypothetical protein
MCEIRRLRCILREICVFVDRLFLRFSEKGRNVLRV